MDRHCIINIAGRTFGPVDHNRIIIPRISNPKNLMSNTIMSKNYAISQDVLKVLMNFNMCPIRGKKECIEIKYVANNQRILHSDSS